MVDDQQLQAMRKYLETEVPFQCDENFTDFRLVDSFEHKLEIGTAKTTVYEVTLESGRKVFAVDGGLPERESQ